MTPAENPIIKDKTAGFGFLIKKVNKLPIEVDNPANRLNKKAIMTVSIFSRSFD